MTVGLPEDAHGQIQSPADALVDHANWSSVMGIGPGLGQSAELTSLVRDLVADYQQPLVVDADGLNALAECPEISFGSNQVILTPHPGEFRRLLESGHGESELQTIGAVSETDQEAAAMSFARRHNVVLVLKGNRTIITDGRTLYRNATGNPGMATGGSGDVLTGVVSAMLAHGLEALQAARLAVHIHGLAGDLAADSLGQISMTARDIVDFLPQAFGRMIR
ncbi:MAG: NAD(P)H-hydrate dehydratase [Pirellulaceae bacterium]